LRSEITILSNLTDSSPFGQAMSLQHNLEQAGIDYRLIVLNNGCIETHKQFETHASYYKEAKFELSNSEAINTLIRESDTKYLCILPNNVYCSKNWLYDLLYYATKIDRSGIAAICPGLTKGYMTNYLDYNQELTSVFVNDNNIVAGPMMFSQALVGRLGALNPALHYGYEIMEYCARAGKLGFYNYYIPEQNAITIDEISQPKVWDCTIDTYKAQLKSKDNFIKLYERTPNQDKAWTSIDLLVTKLSNTPHKTNNQSTSNFGIVSNLFSKDDVRLIKDFAENYNLDYAFLNPEVDSKIKVVFFNP